MIRTAILYPNRTDAKFDHDYYVTQHMRMVIEKLTPMGMVKAEVDKGIGGASGAPPPYVAVGYMLFNSIEDLQKALSAHEAEFIADLPNFTNIEPQVQISEVLM